MVARDEICLVGGGSVRVVCWSNPRLEARDPVCCLCYFRQISEVLCCVSKDAMRGKRRGNFNVDVGGEKERVGEDVGQPNQFTGFSLPARESGIVLPYCRIAGVVFPARVDVRVLNYVPRAI